MRRWLVLLGVAVLAGLFARGVVALNNQKTATVDEPAPDFSLPDLAGRPTKLSDFRGQVVLINMWATWCPPCRDEMPALQRLHEESGGRVKILAVNRAEPVEPVKKFVEKYGITFTVLMDKEDRLIRTYTVTGIPESFFVDAKGVLRAKWVGPMTLEQMRRLVRQTEQAGQGQ